MPVSMTTVTILPRVDVKEMELVEQVKPSVLDSRIAMTECHAPGMLELQIVVLS